MPYVGPSADTWWTSCSAIALLYRHAKHRPSGSLRPATILCLKHSAQHKDSEVCQLNTLSKHHVSTCHWLVDPPAVLHLELTLFAGQSKVWPYPASVPSTVWCCLNAGGATRSAVTSKLESSELEFPWCIAVRARFLNADSSATFPSFITNSGTWSWDSLSTSLFSRFLTGTNLQLHLPKKKLIVMRRITIAIIRTVVHLTTVSNASSPCPRARWTNTALIITRFNGNCAIRLVNLSRGRHFVAMSARLKRVFTFSSLMDPDLTYDWSHNSRIWRCFTFPDPFLEAIPLAAELSHFNTKVIDKPLPW